MANTDTVPPADAMERPAEPASGVKWPVFVASAVITVAVTLWASPPLTTP